MGKKPKFRTCITTQRMNGCEKSCGERVEESFCCFNNPFSLPLFYSPLISSSFQIRTSNRFVSNIRNNCFKSDYLKDFHYLILTQDRSFTTSPDQSFRNKREVIKKEETDGLKDNNRRQDAIASFSFCSPERTG